MTITPFLWFDTQAEEAMTYYASVFERSRIKAVHRAQGRVLSVEFELEGQPLMALNGGPHHRFTEAISLFVSCDTQADIDRLWAKFIGDGGTPDQCGWLKDKFGLSWQIIPSSLGSLLSGGGDAARGGRVWNAMLQMVKLDVAGLQQAYDGN
jgi:predicted 3-demethylubiquinone-9 3-methyltransferase (glyoxalase superfamily)